MDRKPAPMVADFAKLIERNVVDVAVRENETVGYVVYCAIDNNMLLKNIAVLPEFAGRGIGKHLIDHVETQAKALGLQSVELYTNVAMTENQAYYPRQGYIEIKRLEQDGFKRIFYKKVLS